MCLSYINYVHMFISLKLIFVNPSLCTLGLGYKNLEKENICL